MIDILNKCTLQEVRPSPFHLGVEGLLLVVNIYRELYWKEVVISQVKENTTGYMIW